MLKYFVPFLFCFALLACEVDVIATEELPERIRMMQPYDADYPEPVTEAEVMTYVYIQILLDQYNSNHRADADFVEYIIGNYISDETDFDRARYEEVEKIIENSKRLRNMSHRIAYDLKYVFAD